MNKIIFYIVITFIFAMLITNKSFANTLYRVMMHTAEGEEDLISVYEYDPITNTNTGTIISSYDSGGNGNVAGEQAYDSYEGKIYIPHGNSTMTIVDVNAKSAETVTTGGNSNTFYFPKTWVGHTVISQGTDAEDNSSTTILGSLDISDSNGNTLIEQDSTGTTIEIGEDSSGETGLIISNTSAALDIQDGSGNTMIKVTSDGATHIGENSLVTQEVNGVQQLYATNSTGSQIDLNIKSGTNLLIGGRNIMDIISGDISGSVALSSALAALPNSSPDAFYTCGLGTGIHDSSSALSAGCASDFSNYAFADNLPKIFQTASFNVGSSFLMNGEPDISEARDMSIKAGITFKFGSVKPTRVADKQNHMLENKIDAVMQENRMLKAQLKEENDTIRQENDLLKAQIAEINTQLKALNMLAMN